MKFIKTTLHMLAIAGVLAFSSAAHATGFHSCEATDKADWASIDALKKKVADDGFEYRRHKPDGGCYEVYLKYTDGRVAEAYYHPVTLELEVIQRRGDILYEKPKMDSVSQASFDTVMALMGAMGKGDMDSMNKLMADDMVWHNEGDKSMPWIGPWEGKEAILKFLGVFSKNLKTTKWENTDAFAFGDTVAIFGKMDGITTHSGKEIGDFTFALRAKVKNGKVVLWHWFEDSYAVSKAYHAK